ncbi:MAG: acetate uptake transporter, partial [Rhodobacterales bacterium]|nr:acetate uptake transporter [Rhodobacterales bacterium]
SSYGFFWLSFGGLVMLPKLGLGTAPGPEALAAYLGVWGVFTGIMFIGTLALTRALQAVFLSLTVLFFLLAIGDFTGSAVIKTIAGLEGILCGSLAIYTGMAQVLNDVYKKTVLPLG